MAIKQIRTYTVDEVCQMLGIERYEAFSMIKKRRFPFPVINTGSTYLIPKAPVDKVLIQGKPGVQVGERQNQVQKKWVKGEYVNWTCKVPNELAAAFKYVVDQMNKKMVSPMTYDDAKRLAFQEFIERRPVE